MLAVAITGFLLIVIAPEEAVLAQDPTSTVVASPEPVEQTAPDESAMTETAPEVKQAEEVLPATGVEARNSARRLYENFLAALPKLLVALSVLLLATIISRLLRWIMGLASRNWERAEAARTLTSIIVWVIGLAVAASVLMEDARALVGSFGLVGLALSWALQTPIESFAGWLMNSFRGYYKVGDRIAVGEIFGDVYHVDFLNTTLWEIGSPTRDGFVHAEQPTGRLITFPNSEVLSGSIINLTRDFPYVWDEIEFNLTSESDLPYAMHVLRSVAERIVGDAMREPAHQYEEILRRARLEHAVADAPELYVATTDWATKLIVRYLVAARERRMWKTRLNEALAVELSRPEHRGRIVQAYPRHHLQTLGEDGHVVAGAPS